jgi:hypothetical protein
VGFRSFVDWSPCGSQFIRGVADLLKKREDKIACLLGTENPLHTALRVRQPRPLWRCALREASWPSPILKGHSPHVSRWLARQLSYAFEQSALQIKMKDFATYRTLMHQAIEFDEVRTRLQTQLMIQAPRSHAGPCDQMLGHSNQPTTLMRDGIVTVAAGACLFSRRQPAI